MTIKSVFTLASALALSACASAPTLDAPKPDSLTVHIKNDSTGTMLMRSGFVHGYASPRCESESKLGNKLSMGADEALATVPVAPGKPFTFAVSTLNSQSFKGNWGCTATATFTPAPGSTYRATLTTANDNATCRLAITDQRDAPVSATAPEYSCARTFAGIVKNGERWPK